LLRQTGGPYSYSHSHSYSHRAFEDGDGYSPPSYNLERYFSTGNPGRRSWNASAFFSTAPSSKFSEDEEKYGETTNTSPRKRGRTSRREHASNKNSNASANPSVNANAKSRNTDDYEQSTIDRIVSSGIGEHQSIDVDSVVTESYLQRLVDDHISNKSRVPPNPNMLLNMLELLQNEEAHISNETVLKIFREVVRSKRVKLLKRGEDVVVKNRYDPRLLRLLVTGYLNAGVPGRACQLLMEWPTESIRHQPGIESYRRVLTALGGNASETQTKQSLSKNNNRRRQQRGNRNRKAAEYITRPDNNTSNNNSINADDTPSSDDSDKNNHFLLAHRLLHHMWRTHTKFPELSLAPDRDCFHRVLASCSSIESMPTAKEVLDDMRRFASETESTTTTTRDNHSIEMSPTTTLDTQPNASTTRVLVNAWATDKGNSDKTIDTQKEAFRFLRRIEEEALTWSNDSDDTPPVVDIGCYNVLLNVLANFGRYELAERLFLRLLTDYLKGEKSDVPPDTVTLNTVLKSHLRANTETAAVSAKAFLERLDLFFKQQTRLRKNKQGGPENTPRLVYDIQPTAQARSTVANLWINLGQPYNAIEILSEAESVYREKEDQLEVFHGENPDSTTRASSTYSTRGIQRFKPDKISYRQIIGALSKLQDPPTAALATTTEEIAERMCRMGHRLNLLTANTVLNCWTKSGHPDRAELFLDETMIEKHRVVPDIISYNTVIHGYAKLGNLDRALELLTRLLEDSLVSEEQQHRRYPKPNVRTFTSVLIALSKEHTVEAAQQAERLLLQMQELNDAPYNLKTRPNNITYNAVMNCWASLSLPSSIRERRHKQKEQHQPKTKDENPDNQAKLNGIAVNWENDNKHHRFGRKAEFVLRSIQSLGDAEKPNAISYNIVMRAYSNDMIKAEELVRDMIANGLEPTEHTFNTLVHVLNRDYRIKDKKHKLKEIKERYFSSSTFGMRDRRSQPHRNRNAALKQ